MTRFHKTATAIATALVLGAGFAAPASAESAWLSPNEVRQQGGIIAPQDPLPANPAYFDETASFGSRAAGPERTDGDGDAAWLSTFEIRRQGGIVGPQDPQPADKAYFAGRAGDGGQKPLAGDSSYPTGGNRR